MTKILMLVGGDYTKDPRVLREKKVIEEYGHTVFVIDHKEKTQHKALRIIEIMLTCLSMVVKSRKQKFDVVHCHDFDTLPAGIIIKKLRKCGLVYDAHEMYSYMVGIPTLRILERKLLKYVDKNIVVDAGTYHYLSTMTDKQITVIENCKDIISYEYKESLSNPFIVLYVGSLSPQRMFPWIVEYIGETGICFAVAGRKTDVAYKATKYLADKYDNVLFLGEIPGDEVIQRTQEADAVICMFDPRNLNCRFGIPNKFYESLVCGRPIIATEGTFLGAMIQNNHCGITTTFSKDGVQMAVKELSENKSKCREYGKAGLRAAISQYNWNKEKQKITEVYRCV